MNKKLKVSGFTLTEIMIALVINSILFAALVTIFIDNLEHYRKVLSTNRLNEQLNSAMQLMVTEIRRAGYWSNAQNDIGLNQNNNPFQAAATDIAVTNGNCILFTYDHNKTGSLPAIASGSDDDRYGFALNNQILQTRPPGAVYSCSNNSAAWENMTDSNLVHITNLSFTLNQTTLTTGPGVQGIVIRSVDISITGQLATDATVTKTVTEHVRIKNDKFIP